MSEKSLQDRCDIALGILQEINTKGGGVRRIRNNPNIKGAIAIVTEVKDTNNASLASGLGDFEGFAENLLQYMDAYVFCGGNYQQMQDTADFLLNHKGAKASLASAQQ